MDPENFHISIAAPQRHVMASCFGLLLFFPHQNGNFRAGPSILTIIIQNMLWKIHIILYNYYTYCIEYYSCILHLYIYIHTCIRAYLYNGFLWKIGSAERPGARSRRSSLRSHSSSWRLRQRWPAARRKSRRSPPAEASMVGGGPIF